MKIVAFLPVKGSSERIKNKNTTLMKEGYTIILLIKIHTE